MAVGHHATVGLTLTIDTAYQMNRGWLAPVQDASRTFLQKRGAGAATKNAVLE